jgi:ubiquinone/menaquinone biosynthesis C-methylase UbiE
MGDSQLLDKEKQQVTEVFEDCADHYATEREHTPYFRAQLAIVHSMLAGERGRLLDIGCAAGGDIPGYRTRQFSVVGIDLAPRMLEFARQRFAGDSAVHFCRADVEHLPFANQSMDHVVCLGVFEFLHDYNTALAEIHRVLRPGGLAIFAIPSAISLYNVTFVLAGATIRPLWRGLKRLMGRPAAAPSARSDVHRNLCVPWKYRALLRQYGFAPVLQRYSNLFVYPLDRFPKLDQRVVAALEPLCSVPLLRCAGSVYMVSARKK